VMIKRDTDQQVSVPAGLRLRDYAGESDVPALVEILNAELAADRISERVSVGQMTAEYGNPSDKFDPARDLTIAEVDGRPVAFAERSWVDTRGEELREYRLGGAVLPEWRRRGIGRLLLADSERRQRQLAATHDTSRRQVFGSWAEEHQAGAIALLEDAGYQAVRWFFMMIRPTLDDIPEVPLPDGLEIRPMTPDLVDRVWHADHEAFRDHWGGFDESEASLRRFLDDPDTDISLWLIAFDGEEVAGGVLNGIKPEENESLGVKRGWLDSVFTRRPWRRRGLARAMIARSLVLLRERGMTSAGLGVDADNPLGALGLYESVGFDVAERATAWRRPMAEVE
jgi:mycothiol synthase